MERKSKPKEIAGLIFSGRHVFCIRALRSDGSPKEGFHLPDADKDPLLSDERSLQREMQLLFSAIVDPMTLVDFTASTRVYLCATRSVFRPVRNDLECRYLPLDGLKTAWLRPSDRPFLEKAASFLPLYLGKKRVHPLSQNEAEEYRLYVNAMAYFLRRDESLRGDANDFAALGRYEADIASIRSAFYFLCDKHHLEFGEYLDLREFTAKKGTK